MKVKNIAVADANALCQRDEDHFFDRKALAVAGKKLQKIAVAFANADGGEFVVGIADDDDEPIVENRWCGASKIEDFNPHLQSLSEITPSLHPEYIFLHCQEKRGYILQVQVDKSPEVHQTADASVYFRKGAQSLPLKDQQRILELQFAKGSASYEDRYCQCCDGRRRLRRDGTSELSYAILTKV